jgi:hypothetical protein
MNAHQRRTKRRSERRKDLQFIAALRAFAKAARAFRASLEPAAVIVAPTVCRGVSTL